MHLSPRVQFAFEICQDVWQCVILWWNGLRDALRVRRLCRILFNMPTISALLMNCLLLNLILFLGSLLM